MPLVLLYMYTWFIGEIGRDTGGVYKRAVALTKQGHCSHVRWTTHKVCVQARLLQSAGRQSTV